MVILKQDIQLCSVEIWNHLNLWPIHESIYQWSGKDDENNSIHPIIAFFVSTISLVTKLQWMRRCNISIDDVTKKGKTLSARSPNIPV